MLLLRLASDDSVLGLESDDGFEIGRISTETGFLLMVGAGLGGATGVAYVVLRSALPTRARAAVWGVVAALLTGSVIVNTDGVDFALLDPKPFAIASFVLLPDLAAFTIAVVVERLLAVEPWSKRWLTVVLALGALFMNVVLVAVAAVAGAAVVLRRVPALARAVLVIGRVAVSVAFVVLAVRSGVYLWRDATEIL